MPQDFWVWIFHQIAAPGPIRGSLEWFQFLLKIHRDIGQKGVRYSAERRLGSVWYTAEWRLGGLSYTAEWRLGGVSYTAEWRLGGVSYTAEWQLSGVPYTAELGKIVFCDSAVYLTTRNGDLVVLDTLGRPLLTKWRPPQLLEEQFFNKLTRISNFYQTTWWLWT